jgi:PAS domain S-box-containing protein
LHQTRFDLCNPDSRGILVQAFRTRQPFLVADINDFTHALSANSIAFVREMGVQALICVPIYYENHSLGVLAVDNVRSQRPLTQTDLSLLTGIASQTAMSIINARSYQQLQESEVKYRDLVENANSIILRRDPGGRITFFNEFAQQLFGFKPDEIIGRHLAGTLLPDSPEVRTGIETLTRRLEHDPHHCLVDDSENMLRNGETVWIVWTYKPIFDEHGKLCEVLCIGNDITALKKAQTEKEDLRERLRLAQKMEAIGTLAGGVAHDLNNILAGIVGYPELLLMELPATHPWRQAVEAIQKSGEKAAAIVQDLLTMARRGVASKELVDLNQVVGEYLHSPEFARLKQKHTTVQINTRLARKLPVILGSPLHLSKTLMNLITNAVEATKAGGRITIATRRVMLNRPHASLKPGTYVALDIADTGVGIAAADIEKIFEPFYTTKKMGRSGTGLGMAVVWGTLQDHDGHIDVHSTVGSGTTFTLLFPRSAATHLHGKLPARNGSLHGNGETILVVDDLPEQRDIARQMLSCLGYNVTVASSGEQALDLLRERSVDLLVLDMIMDPGWDGLETYRQILQAHPGQKAIVASGFSQCERVKEAQRLGAGAYVKKPFVMETIAAAVKAELDCSGRAGGWPVAACN